MNSFLLHTLNSDQGIVPVHTQYVRSISDVNLYQAVCLLISLDGRKAYFNSLKRPTISLNTPTVALADWRKWAER
jgi:hypothetical protein